MPKESVPNTSEDARLGDEPVPVATPDMAEVDPDNGIDRLDGAGAAKLDPRVEPPGPVEGDPEVRDPVPLTAPVLPRLDAGPGAFDDPRTVSPVTEFDGPITVAEGGPELRDPVPLTAPVLPRLDAGPGA